MIAWLRNMLCHPREAEADGPLRQSRELTTEANLRVVRSNHLIERIQNGESGIWQRDMIGGTYPPERATDARS